MLQEQPKKAPRKRIKRKVGRPTKATPELFAAVVGDISRGLTREWACRANGINPETWERWERLPQFPQLRALATGARKMYLLRAIETCCGPVSKRRFNQLAWRLERMWRAEDR